jgi:hypothetical protein
MSEATATSRSALYCRVSTSEQNTEIQLRELRDYLSRRGWTITGEFIDHGVSGAKDSRPELDKLMRAARRREFDVVIVWRFDRFARSVKHLVLALEEFQSLGIGFVSYQEALDTSTPIGKAMFTSSELWPSWSGTLSESEYEPGCGMLGGTARSLVVNGSYLIDHEPSNFTPPDRRFGT